MNEHALTITSPELHERTELMTDDDVLSPGLRDALEGVGSAVGVIAALALVASQLGRARSLLARIDTASSGPRHG
ncbi:MAG: hypothetical protein HYS27_03125 [Deltaproteobacteria bacterium]|nr:hypothetical protein [Deltaproteobacteria bacterium]